jgi:hypothetical protein
MFAIFTETAVIRNLVRGIALVAVALVLATGSSHAQQSTITGIDNLGADSLGYKPSDPGESEFDNQSQAFVKDWREAASKADYQDTEFGQRIYNEASTPTKLEILRLLSKDTPSMLVFLTAISMGLDIESVLQASVKYEPNKSRDLAASAVNLLPLLTQSSNYLYSGYELDDLEREEEDDPYMVEEVIEKFFKDRLVLRPYPDWFEGQFHFMASAAELKRLQAPQKDVRWYRTKSTEPTANRPIFVSLYEATSSVLIDGEERISQALKLDPDARLPVVFIFNRLNERAIDELGYPATIKGMQAAYSDKRLMLTPTPEWPLGEYHVYGGLDEFYEIFNIPEEDDFEPEAWQKLLAEAEDYAVTNTAFLFVILGSPDGEEEGAKVSITAQQQYAAWDDPRTEAAFPYVEPSDGPPLTLENLMGQGLIFNRPDLIAALNALGVSRVPVVFYYVDSARVKPFLRGSRSLIQAAIGIPVPNGSFGGSRGILCASPPCTEEPQ